MSRGREVDPAEVYGDNYKTDNRGAKLSGPNKAAIKAPKPFGQEGRGVEVKESDDYVDDLDAKMAKMLNRNAHTKQLDASAKTKYECRECRKAITEDDKWVEALGTRFHRACFACSECKARLGDGKYFEHGDRARCAACEEKASHECAQCKQPCRPGQESVLALGQHWHSGCFMCTACHKKLAGERAFREKNGKPYCPDCGNK